MNKFLKYGLVVGGLLTAGYGAYKIYKLYKTLEHKDNDILELMDEIESQSHTITEYEEAYETQEENIRRLNNTIREMNMEYNSYTGEFEDDPALQEERAKYHLIQGEPPEDLDIEDAKRIIEERSKLRKALRYADGVNNVVGRIRKNVFDNNKEEVINEVVERFEKNVFDSNNEEILEEEKEVNMQHDKNSPEALNAYFNMLVSSYYDEDDDTITECEARYGFNFGTEDSEEVIDLVRDLFEVDIVSYSDEDEALIDTIMYGRKQFFGDDSIFVDHKVTFGELLVHYADRFVEDMEYGSAVSFINILLANGQFYKYSKDNYPNIITDIMGHVFENNGKTLFGLDLQKLIHNGQNRRYDTQYSLFIEECFKRYIDDISYEDDYND